MNRIKLFESSLKMIFELKQEIIESDVIDCGPRLELVEQCIYISFEHGIGVSTLLTEDLPIQAMILLRSQFEAVVKAYWILHLASNEQIMKLNFSWTFEEQFEKDEFITITTMLNALEKANLPAKPVIQHLCEFKKYHVTQLNSFVHTGKQSFTRDMIGFDGKMALILMRQSNNLITVAAQIMLKHSIPDKQKYIHYILDKYRQCFYMEDDVDRETKERVESYFK